MLVFAVPRPRTLMRFIIIIFSLVSLHFYFILQYIAVMYAIMITNFCKIIRKNLMLWQKKINVSLLTKTQTNNLFMPVYFLLRRKKWKKKLNEYSSGLYVYTGDYYFLLNVNWVKVYNFNIGLCDYCLLSKKKNKSQQINRDKVWLLSKHEN